MDRLKEIEEKVSLVYAYFDNTGALTNLLQLLKMREDITAVQKKLKARADRQRRKKATKKITDF